ncbi:MAG: serine/threonine protein kinase [Thermoguttaceae bacterium]|nr:serine/threonine protein kinase [Thermoguttaceae bacterium]MBQ7111539.1 serine/threonine protein kinase [Thermoguttaceae bacterium]
MTSNSSHSRPISDASDASDASRRESSSDPDATAAFGSVPDSKNGAFEPNGGEPLNSALATPENDALFSFDDASTQTSAPPFGAENDEENERLENERTVVSLTPPVEPEPRNDAADGFDAEDDGGDGGALKPGATFGHFVVTKYIGGGGMGRVYEGRDTALDRKVAIKVLPRQRAQDVGTVARFLNEAKSAARLNHEHIAQVYFCGEENGVPFIAFEYVYGVNLRDYVRERGVLELDEAIGYVLQAADALAHAAAHGVTHRDVKPSNIIVTPQKRAKLIDMGLARLLKNDVVDDLTESGVTLGTFDYISPEQARDPRDADVRSDIYSLGCTFYYMLVGTPPFPEGTMLQKLLQHQGDEPPDVREANPAIPVEVAAVVKKMMRKAPDDRYQTPESLILDLREIAEMIGLRLSGRGGVDFAVEERNVVPTTSRTPAAIVCVAFLAFVAVLYWSPGRPTPILPVVETPIAPVGASSDLNAESRSADKRNVAPSASDALNGTLGSETETTSLGIASDDGGETFAAAELDALYAEARGGVDAVPPLGVDDGAEWRRAFLSGSATSGETNRVAWGWRSRRRIAASGDANVLFATANGGDGATGARFWATAYSFLGSPATATAPGARASATVPNATRTVDRVGEGPQTFATLQAALATGSDGADEAPIRVELKFDGALATPPISLVGRKVEIVAAAGFRPTLVFNPRNVADGGWGERMFHLNASELTLRGVAIDFTVPTQDVVASKWSVFEATGSTVLTLIDSSATVCNAPGEAFSAPLHSNVAIFRSTFETSTLGESETGASETERGAPSVRLDGVFARGEAALFASNGVGDDFEARRCGFNVSGPIFWANEEERTVAVANAGERSSLTFERVVVVGRSALASLGERGDADGETTPLDVSLTNSAIWLDGAPLATVSTARERETNPAPNAWNLDGSLLLDAEPALRARARQTSTTRDWPLAFDSPPNASTKLNDLSADAVARLSETPPHRFALTDFGRWILTPAQTSSALDAATRKLAGEIKATVVDGESRASDAERRASTF